MRVTLLTHYFPPEVGAPQARLSALAAGLGERGFDLTVHTGFPHYPDGAVRRPYRNRLRRRDRIGATPVIRSIVYPTANAGFAGRVLDHAVFAAGAAAMAPADPPADVVVVESPPLLTAAAGVAYARLKGAALVLIVSDHWPASAVELGALRDPRLIRASEWLERRCYAAARAIVVPTEGLERDLVVVPEAAGKVVRVPPAVDLDRFRPAPRPDGERARFLYAGTIGLAQNLGTLCTAAQLVDPNAFEITIAGDGAQLADVRRDVAERGITNVEILGGVPHDEVPGRYAGADGAVVLLRDRPIFEGALPTKLLEAMASGRAVVVSARGEAATLVERAGAGVAVEPENSRALAEALSRLAGDRPALDRMGEAGRRFAEGFGRARMVDRWAELLVSCGATASIAPRCG